MPLHLYRCSVCQKEQERLVRTIGGLAPTKVSCEEPGCPGPAERLPELQASNIPPSGTYSFRGKR